MPALLRILFIIPLGYVAACLAAGTAIMLAIYRMGATGYAIDALAIGFALAASVYAGAVAALPMAVFVILAEAFAWRSALVWCLFGGILGLGAQTYAERTNLVFAAGKPLRFVAAGLVFGAVYWLIAGRGSGSAIAKKPERLS